MAVVALAFLLVLHHEILTGNDIVFVAGGGRGGAAVVRPPWGAVCDARHRLLVLYTLCSARPKQRLWRPSLSLLYVGA